MALLNFAMYTPAGEWSILVSKAHDVGDDDDDLPWAVLISL